MLEWKLCEQKKSADFGVDAKLILTYNVSFVWLAVVLGVMILGFPMLFQNSRFKDD